MIPELFKSRTINKATAWLKVTLAGVFINNLFDLAVANTCCV